MEIFLYNLKFIWFNSFLAIIAVVSGWMMLKPYLKLIRIFCGFIWFIFLPNTIYILTDVSHLFEDWSKVDILFKLILLIQYSLFSIFGVITFVLSVYFFQKLLEGKMKKIKFSTLISICVLNFLVGFAVILGGIERTNSWYVFTDPPRVIADVIDVFSSLEMLMLAAGVGILANVIYFLMLESVITWGGKFFKS